MANSKSAPRIGAMSSGSRRKTRWRSDSDATDGVSTSAKSKVNEPQPKKRRLAISTRQQDITTNLSPSPEPTWSPAPPPSRHHPPTYHRPLLLSAPSACTAILAWFDAAASARCMPWRKPFLLPATTPRAQLEARAYEVWISEVMLQQTRVATVVDYWTRWTARWPTVRALAAATEDEVLGQWRGLGYYGRARRVLLAARVVVGMGGLMPVEVGELQRGVPGVGRYTAGAIASIVFGRAEAMVDGNVLRVLSRQMGVYGDVKRDKAVVDLLWAAADALVKAVARDGEEGDADIEPEPSDRPGRWGQALMELGSTVCTPKPNCSACPITATCRAYTEGAALAEKRASGKRIRQSTKAHDIEDACTLCEPFQHGTLKEEISVDTDSTSTTTKRQTRATRSGTRSHFFADKNDDVPEDLEKRAQAMVEEIANYARKFPLKVEKKAIREEETLVCAIRRGDGRYLIQRRPEKGQLAGLWEFPSHILPEGTDTLPKIRKSTAQSFVLTFVAKGKARSKGLEHIGELESIPWRFSHLKMTLHVHLFTLDDGDAVGGRDAASPRLKWATSDEVDRESMGTGMRKCWHLVKGSEP